MTRDVGSRTPEFMSLVASVRSSLLDAASAVGAGYEAILLQGSGTFGIEAVLGSVTPASGRWLVVSNGVYGDRIHETNRALGVASRVLRFPPERSVDAEAVAFALDRDRSLSHVAVVHCETSTGIVNPVMDIAYAARERGRRCLVDAMSSFGSIPISLRDSGIDYLISSPNKSMEGVPGFCFVLARRDALEEAQGPARSLSLDLIAQWRVLEQTGQFRFTPPVQALLAFEQALRELAGEGGIARRGERYARNSALLSQGMASLGFEPLFEGPERGYLISSFRQPGHPAYDYDRFSELLHARGCVVYPGNLRGARYFRIGTMGHITAADVRNLLGAIPEALRELGVTNGRPSPTREGRDA